VNDDSSRPYTKATQFCCAKDDDGSLEVGTGDACCGSNPWDQKLFTIGDQFCCAGVLSVHHPSFKNDELKNVGLHEWREASDYFWGYELNASSDSTHYGTADNAVKMCVVNASSFYAWGPTGGAGDTTKAPVDMTSEALSMLTKKSDVPLQPAHSCVRGNSDLQCCSNYTYTPEVQYRDDLPNAKCCGQLVYDDVNDHCCAVQSYADGFHADTAAGIVWTPGASNGSYYNRGNIRHFRTTGHQNKRCCGDNLDYEPLHATDTSRTRCCIDNDEETVYSWDI
jgi:hypothetical protein